MRHRPVREVAALQAALAAENAAVYGYGVVGAHLAGPRRAAAVRDWVAHQTGRDTLTRMLVSLHVPPLPAAAAYDLPFAVRGPRAAVRLAADIEDRVAGAYLAVVALPGPELRAFGARQVRAAALRATAWRGSCAAFPGLDLPGVSRAGNR